MTWRGSLSRLRARNKTVAPPARPAMPEPAVPSLPAGWHTTVPVPLVRQPHLPESYATPAPWSAPSPPEPSPPDVPEAYVPQAYVPQAYVPESYVPEAYAPESPEPEPPGPEPPGPEPEPVVAVRPAGAGADRPPEAPRDTLPHAHPHDSGTLVADPSGAVDEAARGPESPERPAYVGRRRARPVKLGFVDGSEVELDASTPAARALRQVAAVLARRD